MAISNSNLNEKVIGKYPQCLLKSAMAKEVVHTKGPQHHSQPAAPATSVHLEETSFQ